MASFEVDAFTRRYVDWAIRSGRYESAAALLHEALQLHAAQIDPDPLTEAELKSAIGEGLSDLDAGRWTRVDSAKGLAALLDDDKA